MQKFSKGTIIFGAIVGIIFLLGFWVMANYSSLVASSNKADKSWADVESHQQRRYDLVDNLVAVPKASMAHESDVFIKIAEARTRYNAATNESDKVAAANDIETNIALLPRLQEAYPELKSNEQMQTLMNKIEGTEDGLLKARNRFNEDAADHNKGVKTPPKSVVAYWFGFKEKPLFKAEQGAEKAPKVSF